MSDSRSRRLGIQGLGWVVRRFAGGPVPMVPFYQAALGIRQLRPPGPTGAVMLWSGDIAMLELSALNAGPDSTARRADMTVVFRARDLARAQAMMVAAGAKPVSEVSAPTPTVVVADPEGFKIGLRQAPAAPRLIHDRNADEQWRRGPLTLPNVPGLPPDIQDIAAIVVKVVDPFAMAAFYADLFGFEVIDGPTAAGATLWLGRTTVLELVAGGRKYAVPSDRDQVPDVWIARIYDYDAFAARLGERQVPVVTQRQITGGKLTYAVDPEGHLFGVQQRTPDLLPAAGKERVEDALARDLWAEGH